ncbi:hypothetical protein FACS1894178_6100 [Bacteroidia bacterium]|nr:hypothetical protein FACS1894178_6100 [Bacteroidia bacterium]
MLLTSRSASQKASKQTDKFNAAPNGDFVPDTANFNKIVNPDWTMPVKINSINTEWDEMYPVWLNDNCFAFSSNGLPGEGGLDIYLAIRDNENSDFSTVFMLEGPINSEYDDLLPICDKRNKKVFFNSDRAAIDGETGGIYSFRFQSSKLVLNVAAKENDGTPIKSLVQIKSIDNNHPSLVTDENGELQYEIPNLLNDYEITVSSQGYIPQTRNFKANEALQYLNTLAYQELDFFLEKENPLPLAENDAPNLTNDELAEESNNTVKNNPEISLNHVYFDFNKEYCREDGRRELDKIIAFGKQNPSYQIKIETHADERGSFAYNDKLAERRLNFIKKHLTSNGIAIKRISFKIYGKRQPYIANAHQPEEHLLNRRATFKFYTADGELVTTSETSIID